MCYGCWEELGSPRLDTPRVRQAAALVKELYDHPHGALGADCHILTDDWNTEDEHVAYCAQRVTDALLGIHRYEPYSDYNLILIQDRLLDLMIPMSEAERRSALALYDEFWSTDA